MDRTNSSIQMVRAISEKLLAFLNIISPKAWLPDCPDKPDDPLGGLVVFSSEGELETFLQTVTAQEKARNVAVVEINSRLTLA